jgi:hypothetical protein
MTGPQRAMLCLRRHRAPWLILLLLPVLANALPLSGLVITDPATLMIALIQNFHYGWLHGTVDWLDPTIGGLAEPLARLAGQDWLHGIIPWWNPYSGVGMPLAAELQAYAFFLPSVFLFQFHLGWLLLRIVLQWGSGLFTYALLIELGLGRRAACLAGALFAFCPIFFLSPHASSAPLPFLPLLLLGIEYAAGAARARRPMGWSLIVVATAYSVYAGFPETTYADGVLAAIWSLWRFGTLPWTAWPAFAGKLIIGLVIALGLCAPLLVPFLDYLPYAYLGQHEGAAFGSAYLSANLVPLQLMPYLYGPYNSVPPPPFNTLFSGGGSYVRIWGWVGIPALTMALLALARRGSLMSLRYVLLGWVVIWELRYLGLPPLIALFNLLPGFSTADYTRFSGPATNLALAILAGFAFDDYTRLGRITRARLLIPCGAVIALALAAIWSVRQDVRGIWHEVPFLRGFALANLAGVAIVMLLLGRELRRPRHAALLLAALISGPLLSFVFPQLSGWRSGTLDIAPIRYLQAQTGTSRMLSLGQFDLSLPAAYHIASINYLEMPAPGLFADFIHASLGGDISLNIFRGGMPSQAADLQTHLAAYEAIGVKYVVTGPDTPVLWTPIAAAGAPGPANIAQSLAATLPDLTGQIYPEQPVPLIAAATVRVGTYRGHASGPLTLTLCAAGQCRSATADAGRAADGGPMRFTLAAPLAVQNGTPISFSLHHGQGNPIAIWLGPTPTGETPIMQLIAPADTPSPPRLVFADGSASIFELPNPAPYASTADPACQITIATRQKILTNCPTPTTLIRREMYFPGWGARIGGDYIPLRQDGLFQAVPIPAGPSEVQFFFQPRHIHAACAAALLALAAWGGLGWRGRRESKRFFFSKKNILHSV